MSDKDKDGDHGSDDHVVNLAEITSQVLSKMQLESKLTYSPIIADFNGLLSVWNWYNKYSW